MVDSKCNWVLGAVCVACAASCGDAVATATGSPSTTTGNVGTESQAGSSGATGSTGSAATGATTATGDTPAQPSGGASSATGTPSGGSGTVSDGGSSSGAGAPTSQGGSTATGTGGASTGGAPVEGTAGSGANGGAGGEATTVTECATPEEELFSFFMISYEAVVAQSGSDAGFGGDLGGLEGADEKCRIAAMTSSDCAGSKKWRAFLSTTTVDAIDRIGPGPWYDRLGRLLANDTSELLNDRPINADPLIINDFPNEFGVPNKNPDGTGDVDNHQTLTGSDVDGRLYTQEATGSGGSGSGGGMVSGSTACPDGFTPEKATCKDWTSSEPWGCPRVGHSWPREFTGVNWISVWNERGCGAGVVEVDSFDVPGAMDAIVGSFGGYGGWYCFVEAE